MASTTTMAQGRVTDFFSTRKRNGESQPSKRRKVQITSSEVDVSTLDITNTSNSFRNQLEYSKPTEQTEGGETKVFSPIQTRASRAKNKSGKAATKSTRLRKPKVDPKQTSIQDAFKSTDFVKESISVKGELTLTDAVTSSWDEHDGPERTPSKLEPTGTSRKRTRHKKSNPKADEGEATPEKRSASISEVAHPKSDSSKVRKRLQLKSKAVSDSPVEDAETDVIPVVKDDLTDSKTPSVAPAPCIQEVNKTAVTKDVPVSDKVQEAIERCKSLKSQQKTGTKGLNVNALKEKLSKCGKLEELKSQLSKMKETSAMVKTPAPQLEKFKSIQVEVERTSDVKTTAPAYERFHSLASKGPPALSIPYKYKVLAETFRGMDTVVSMLHNRNEICTFSKLKAAVQELNKKNFEQSHVGQIKTVYPDAYHFRQEKGLPMFGNKTSGYQLTVEANLQSKTEGKDKSGRSNFAASDLLSRRNIFHHALVKIVMKHHKEFLSKLSRPLSVPDDKITRWHPKFPLDEVPDISPSPLPEAPNVKTFTSAKDVLNHQKGKLSPRVEKALTAVMRETKDEAKEEKTVTPVITAPISSAHKGIPLSLLEKIRAKEAKNTATALTRNPEEERKTVMIKRLPEIMRIMRTHFVTEKKPSLPQESVIQKLVDSYKSCISAKDVEAHVGLIQEYFPDWLTVIPIKKGKYLKIDKNVDLQTLSDKVNNIVKSRK